MGTSSGCMSSRALRHSVELDQEGSITSDGVRWLNDSVFGPEPEYNKRLEWLQGDEKDDEKRVQEDRQQFTIVVSQSVSMDSQDLPNKGIENSVDCVGEGSDMLLKVDSSLPKARVPPSNFLDQRFYSKPKDSLSRDLSESPQYSPSPSSQHLHPHSALLNAGNLPGSFRLETVPWVEREARTKSLPLDGQEPHVAARPYRSMIVTMSCSTRFLEGTRYIQLSRSASQLVHDLDSIQRELSIPGSSDVGEFQKSVMIAKPSAFAAQKFLDTFMPFLESKPIVFESLGTLDFDAFNVASLPKPWNTLPLLTTTVAVLWRLRTIELLKLSWLPVVKFLINIEENYNDNAYHCNWHAADVVGTMAYFICKGWFKKSLTPVHHIISILAAASHDVDHNAQNNNFHRLAKTPIGVSYPESNLEYHHIAKATGIRNLPGCDWTTELIKVDPNWTRERVWTFFSTLILRTDPALYDPENRKPFTDLADCTKEELNESQEPALMEILHLADISNPVKPRGIARTWASRFYKEFDDLGQEVRKLRLEMPIFLDPAKMPTLPDTQVFFVSKICLPSFEDLVVFMPEVKETVDNMKSNLEYWKIEQETMRRTKSAKWTLGPSSSGRPTKSSSSLGSLRSPYISDSDIQSSKLLSPDVQDRSSTEFKRSRSDGKSISSKIKKLKSLKEKSNNRYLIPLTGQFLQRVDKVSHPSNSSYEKNSSFRLDSKEKGSYSKIESSSKRITDKISPVDKLGTAACLGVIKNRSHEL